jgi:hypothetical protein
LDNNTTAREYDMTIIDNELDCYSNEFQLKTIIIIILMVYYCQRLGVKTLELFHVWYYILFPLSGNTVFRRSDFVRFKTR